MSKYVSRNLVLDDEVISDLKKYSRVFNLSKLVRVLLEEELVRVKKDFDEE